MSPQKNTLSKACDRVELLSAFIKPKPSTFLTPSLSSLTLSRSPPSHDIPPRTNAPTIPSGFLARIDLAEEEEMQQLPLMGLMDFMTSINLKVILSNSLTCF